MVIVYFRWKYLKLEEISIFVAKTVQHDWVYKGCFTRIDLCAREGLCPSRRKTIQYIGMLRLPVCVLLKILETLWLNACIAELFYHNFADNSKKIYVVSKHFLNEFHYALVYVNHVD